jgi:C-terminal processing protease CtpA/Prc
MAAVFADNGIATLVGERTGGDGCGFMYTSTYTLPSRRMRVRIPNCVRLRRGGADEAAGIAPNIELPSYDGESAARHAQRIVNVVGNDMAAQNSGSRR